MITAIVRFKLPDNVTLDAATELFKGSAPKYQNLPGLVRKYYLSARARAAASISGRAAPTPRRSTPPSGAA